MGIAHFALELGAGHEGCDRVDYQNVQSTGPDQHVRDFQGLLSGVGLRDQQLIHIDADCLGINRIEGMLDIDEGGDTPVALRLSHNMERESGLSRTLWTVNFDDAPSGDTSDSQCNVERKGSGRNHLHLAVCRRAQLHDGAFAILAFDLADSHLQGFLAFHSFSFQTGVTIKVSPGTDKNVSVGQILGRTGVRSVYYRTKRKVSRGS